MISITDKNLLNQGAFSHRRLTQSNFEDIVGLSKKPIKWNFNDNLGLTIMSFPLADDVDASYDYDLKFIITGNGS